MKNIEIPVAYTRRTDIERSEMSVVLIYPLKKSGQRK
jgi:hypothetical protein